jgi:hypothetical protein
MRYLVKRFVFSFVVAAGLAGVIAATNKPTASSDEVATPQNASPPVPSAKAVRGASPYVEIKDEAPPKLIVDDPLPEGLAIGVVWIQYRVENLRIMPVFGESAAKVSPRVGHLHVTVDDLPWWWADASDSNTIDIAGLPVGRHKVRIELVGANHRMIPGQTRTVTFNLPVQMPHE